MPSAVIIPGLRAAAMRFAWAGVCAMLAVTSALGGFGFLIAVLYLHLSQRLAPIGAALAVGGGLLAVAVLSVLIACWTLRRSHGRTRSLPGMDVGAGVARWAAAHPYAAVAVAVVAGMAVGANPSLRRDLEPLAGVFARGCDPRP